MQIIDSDRDKICGVAHHVNIYHAILLACLWTVYVCAFTTWLCLHGHKEPVCMFRRASGSICSVHHHPAVSKDPSSD